MISWYWRELPIHAADALIQVMTEISGLEALEEADG
jgi:hypothetical protein